MSAEAQLADPAEAAAAPQRQEAALSGVDIDAILAPVPGDSPAGAPLRYAGDYDRIREARREDDAALPQGVWQSDVKRANWDEVVRLALDALTHRSKDIQIGAWLLEALVHRDGFAGLPVGLSVLIGLCNAFWPSLYPEIDEGDLSYRLAPFEWANEKLPPTIFRLPLTEPGIVTPVAYGWSDHANAMRLEQIHKASPNTKLGTGVRLAEFEAAATSTPTPFYRSVNRRLDTSLALLAELDRVLDEHCGKAAPSLAGLRQALLQVQGLVKAILRNRGEVPMTAEAMKRNSAEAAEPRHLAPEPDEERAAPAAFDGVIHDRDEAYRLILEIAEYLARNEPHSPTPYLLRRAYSWGMMPLHELLGEMTRGRNDLAALFELLGLNH